MSKHVKLNDAGDAEITLAKPLDVNGVKVTGLVMREPLVTDQLVMEATSGNQATKEVAFFANLTGHTPADIGRLTMRDYGRLQEAYKLFTD